MSADSDFRHLTRRGYQRTQTEVWQDEPRPESTAPEPLNDGVDHLRPVVADWGRTVDEAQAMLREQMCPVCGEGPWQSPLNHVSRKHGIDRFTMRDICGLTTRDSVVDPELAARFAENGRTIDLARAREAGRNRRPQRWTAAGRAKNTATLTQWMTENPEQAAAQRRRVGASPPTSEARAKVSAAMKAWHESNPERRRAFRELMASPEVEAKRAAKRSVPDCGTVARYKHGCRCDACRQAKAEYRKTLPRKGQPRPTADREDRL